ncbi:MAG: prephenate dehydrogenase [Chloroflexi bacterium]|nr:prephenate dehydrogenase [Chloroflexota bacterium]
MDDSGFTQLADARVAIVGLGLMGGSLALALKGRCREIIGVDSDTAPLTLALERGIIHRPADFDSALDSADLLILATPAQTILAQLTAISHSDSAFRIPHSVFPIDLGSTKRAIVAAMENLPPAFDPIGGHPMCGKETSGIEHADRDLFRGKPFILCPLRRTSSRALALAHELVSVIGARPLVLDAETHDEIAAAVSHLPYAVSAALVRTAMANSNDALWQMASSGFRDTTRLAASDLTMMIDILLTNRNAVLHSLSQFHSELEALTAAIESGDPERLRAVLESAQRQRHKMFRES